jgi:hypothetical protein
MLSCDMLSDMMYRLSGDWRWHQTSNLYYKKTPTERAAFIWNQALDVQPWLEQDVGGSGTEQGSSFWCLKDSPHDSQQETEFKRAPFYGLFRYAAGSAWKIMPLPNQSCR